jgi:nicotinate-nucleotide adenylyltransferase
LKTGVFGGTFDPVHNGHLRLAGAALAQLGLDELIFMPAGEPWFKAARQITAAVHRVAMVKLAISGLPRVSLSTMEVERAGPTFTVATLRELREQLGDAAEIYFLMSYSTLEELTEWHQPAEIIRRCRLAVAPRPGTARPDLAGLESRLPGISRRVDWLEMPEVAVSATTVRERVSRGEAVGEMVPATVAEYIREHRLYTP